MKMYIKKLTFSSFMLVVLLVMLFCPMAVVLAEEDPGGAAEVPDVEVVVDGREIELEHPARIVDNKTLLPARDVFEGLRAVMEWDGDARIASGTIDEMRVDIPIGSKEAEVNGKREDLDVKAQIFEDRTYIPLRFAGEAFGGGVDWDGDTRTVNIAMPEEIGEKIEPKESYEPELSEELEKFSKLVDVKIAGGELDPFCCRWPGA